MTQQLKSFIDIQFSETYEPSKARRLVEEIKRLQQTINALIKEVNSSSNASSGLVEHDLVGHFHKAAGLDPGTVLMARTDDTFGFDRMTFADLLGVDPLTFVAPSNGDILQFIDGYYSMASAASVAGAPSNGEYLLGVDNSSLPSSRVIEDSDTILWDTSTAGQVKLHIAANSLDNTHFKSNYARGFMLMGA